MFARAMVSKHHPILAQIIPIRRCNFSCTYCNEFDTFPSPSPWRRCSTASISWRISAPRSLLSAGANRCSIRIWKKLSARVRSHGIFAGMITNGYLFTAERIQHLNRAGLDHLQISIDNVLPDEVSKKSLKVLDRKLQMLARMRFSGQH